MKKISSLIIVLCILCLPFLSIAQQVLLQEDFETGVLNPFISLSSVGSFNSLPGIKNITNFGSAKAFGFGISTCPANCFNNYLTDLTITLPPNSFVDSIQYCEMELYGNWGSYGEIYINGIILPNSYIGNLPTNDFTPDLTPRCKSFVIGQPVSSIMFHVWDITDQSEINIDDLIIYGNSNSTSIVALSSSDSSFCEKNCIDFTDISNNNPTSWQWFFPGASPDTSTLQNPTNICYNNYGSYDVTLVACNGGGCDTLHLANFIKCYQNPVDSIWQSNDTLYSLAANSYQWYEASTGLIAAATNQFYVITQPGNYYCVVVDSIGCNASSNTIAATGISEGSTNGFIFSTYPNPANSILNVVFNDARNLDYQIVIYNQLSQQVLSKKISGNKYAIDISNLPHGMYFARIINASSNQISNLKFIVEH